MNKILNLQYINKQGQTAPFIDSENPISITKFRYEAKRMGGAPTISFDFRHHLCLDDIWEESTFAEFNGERYFLARTPSSSYSNEDARYLYDVTLVSERAALDSVYFYDVVSEDYEGDKPVSNSTNVTFHGTIKQFVERLNYSLQYAKLQDVDNGVVSGYRVVIDEGVTSEDKLVAFDNEFISNVLQEIYNTYGLPYYFVGKEIHIGYESEVIETVFEYGIDAALLSIKRENSNNAIINRCTGVGSTDNIPYYYPNRTPLGNVEVVANGGFTAKISDASKFSSNRVLNETLTYSTITSNTPDGLVSYGVSRVVDGKWNEVPLNDGVYYYEEDNVYANSNVDAKSDKLSLWSIIDTKNLDYSIGRMMEMRFTVDIKQINPGSDAEATELYEDLLQANIGSVHVFIDGGKSTQIPFDLVLDANTGLTRGVSIKYNVESGHKYKFEFYPILGVELPYAPTTSDMKAKFNTINCKLGLSMEATYQKNDTYVVGYGWLYDNGKVQSLPEIGVSVNGEPKLGDTISFNLISRYDAQRALMPSIYRETYGAERFYNAVNGEYEGYVFPNPYIEGKPKEHIAEFQDIKPTITGMKNSYGEALDKFKAIAYDVNDSDETEEKDGSVVYKHPYIFAKLPKLGFNLFDHAIENGEMTISMTSGNCGACNFVIAVSQGTDGKFYNTVQTDKNGNLVYDDNGNVLCGRKHYQSAVEALEWQNDTTDNEVWIALTKDDDTYGTLMPNDVSKPTTDDTFVIINISMPEAFIVAAEKRLDKAILDYMLDNNQEKFNFSLDFSRIYLQDNPAILEKLTENARIQIKYNERTYVQYVNSFTYNVDDNPIPQISVNLVESLSIAQNVIERAVSDVTNKMTRMISSIDVASACLPYFLRKDTDDTASGKITFERGAEFGKYESGALGTGGAVQLDANGNSIAEFDFLNVRKKASFTEITVQELKNVGGQLILSPAAMKCSRVETLTSGDYRCYFESTGYTGEIVNNEFVVGDLARCQTFNLGGNRYYWREVVGVGSDYIDLSATKCDTSVQNDMPMAGDNIASLGHISDGDRQAAIILSAYGNNAPSMTQYAGIDSFSLENKMVTKFSNGENVVTGKMTILPNSTGAANISDLKIGGANLLRNSGFTGDYEPKLLDEGIDLNSDNAMWSEPTKYWEVENAIVVESIHSQSGYEIVVNEGIVSQNVENLILGDNYVLSFKAKGEVLSYALNGEESALDGLKTDVFERFVIQVTPNGDILNIKFSGTFALCDVQLERGTIATAWSASYSDNSKELAQMQAVEYLQNAISEGKTEILGGLVLSNIIKVGNYANKELLEETGGMSGVRNSDNDVAFWAGGDFKSAITTVNKYLDNPRFIATEEDLATMAKFVVTHGGRAILNDIILRGYVYAEGGVFNGTVYADSGVFNGFVKRAPTIIDGSNFNEYMAEYEVDNNNSHWYELDIDKAGSFIIFDSNLQLEPHFYLPCLVANTDASLAKYYILPHGKNINDIYGYVGQTVIVVNNTQKKIYVCTGTGCYWIGSDCSAKFECIMEVKTEAIEYPDGNVKSEERLNVSWKVMVFENPEL